MPNTEIDTRQDLQALLARDHQELDQLFEALLNALQADAREDTLRLWTAFEDGLCRHMALEEEHVLPFLKTQDAREAEALAREHQEIRTKLAELGVGVDLHEIRVQTVSDFVEQLRRHAAREDALAYVWARENVPAAHRERVRSGLAAARKLRRRVVELSRKARARVASMG